MRKAIILLSTSPSLGADFYWIFVSEVPVDISNSIQSIIFPCHLTQTPGLTGTFMTSDIIDVGLILIKV